MKLTIRNPFDQAQEQYQSRTSTNGTVISSSPVKSPNDSLVSIQPTMEPGQSGLLSTGGPGPDFRTLSLRPNDAMMGVSNDVKGKQELINRLIKQFGPDYQNNPEAQNILKQFDGFLSFYNKDPKEINKSLENANRTLGAIMGSNPFASRGFAGQGGI